MNYLANLASKDAQLITNNLFPLQTNSLAFGDEFVLGKYDIIPWEKSGFTWETDFGTIEKQLRHVLQKFSADFICGDSFPRINVYYNKKTFEYVVEAVIAGIDKNDISVTIDSGRLVFEYSKKFKSEDDLTYFHREITESSFKKTIKIPESADLENVRNTYADGVMTIVFPTKESSKPKKLSF